MGASQCSSCESAKRFDPGQGGSSGANRIGFVPRLGGVTSSELVQDARGALDDFYEVDRALALGEGSFSMVHRCVLRATQQVRAVKIIKRSLVRNPARVEQEVEIFRALDHPNVLRLVETFQDPCFVQLVSEICNGGEVFDLIIDTAPLSEAQAAPVVGQMCRAVAYLHSCSVIHRDLKAENWLLVDKLEGKTQSQRRLAVESARVVLADFGCARVLAPGVMARTKCGSPYYIAPEVIQGSYDKRADCWTLGVLTYMLLGGAPLVGGSKTEEVLEQVTTMRIYGIAERLAPRLHKPPLSVEARTFLLALLERDVARRLSSQAAAKDRWIMLNDISAAGVLGRRVSHQKHAPQPNAKAVSALKSLRAYAQAAETSLGELVSMPDGEGQAGKEQVTQERLRARAARVSGAMVVAQLERSALRDLEAVFVDLDVDRDGVVSCDELQDGFKCVGIKIERAEAKRVFETADLDGSGAIDFSEFVLGAVDAAALEDGACWNAFKAFDVSSTGFVEPDDFKRVIEPTDVPAESRQKMDELFDQIFEEIDKNANGFFDFEEFLALLDRAGRPIDGRRARMGLAAGG